MLQSSEFCVRIQDSPIAIDTKAFPVTFSSTRRSRPYVGLDARLIIKPTLHLCGAVRYLELPRIFATRYLVGIDCDENIPT